MADLKSRNGKFNPAKFNQLVDTVEQNIIRNGIGYKVHKNSGGTVLDIKPGVGQGGASAAKPWAVTAQESGVTVNAESYLYKYQSLDKLEISNITGFLPVAGGDTVYIQGEYNLTGAINTDPFTIEKDVTSIPATGFSNWKVEYDTTNSDPPGTGIFQKFWRFPIANITDFSGALIVEQLAFNHLGLTTILHQGKLATYPEVRS